MFSILGTLCARNIYEQSCFFSGESGSPLMIKLSRLVLINSYGHFVVLGRKMNLPTDLSLKVFSVL